MKGPRRAAAIVLAIAAVLTVTSAAAQSPPASPPSPPPSEPGPYLIDVRGAISGVPASTGFHPDIPASAFVPKRGFGPEVGVHFYPKRLGPARIGLGVSAMRVRGTANDAVAVATTTTTTTTTTTDTTAPVVVTSVLSAIDPIRLATTMTVIAPQVSFNFGTRDGWSYLGGGYGAAEVHSSASGTTVPPLANTVTLTRADGWTASINYGGGARWFIRDRIAVGFDVRFHRIAALGDRPATKFVVAAVGVSLR